MISAFKLLISLIGAYMIIASASSSASSSAATAEYGETLNAPYCIRAAENRTEPDSGIVLSVFKNSECCAYPLRILSYHRVVNDRLGGAAVLAVYDPISAAGTAYDPIVNGMCLQFDAGNNTRNLLTIRDRETKSIWSILTGVCESGAMKGRRMYRIPSWRSTWRIWRHLHPDSWLLKELRDQVSHYPPYLSSDTPAVEIKQKADLSHPKFNPAENRFVLGVLADGYSEIFPLNSMPDLSGATEFRLHGRRLVLLFDSSESASGAYVPELNGRLLTFSAKKNGQNLQFSDDQTHSVWGFDGRAVSGELKGQMLSPAVSIYCRYDVWTSAFPKNQIYSSSHSGH